MRRPWGTFAAVLLLASGPAAADHHVRWQGSADLGAGYDGNPGNAAAGADEQPNAFAGANLHLDWQWRPTLYTGVTLRGSAGGEGYAEDSKLSNGRLALLARVAHRPAGGFHMPLLAAWASGAYREFGSEIRSGAEFRAGTWLAMPLTTAIGLRASLGVAERMATEDVFDLSTRSAGVDLDWRLARRVTTYLGYQFIDGDLVSTSSVEPGGGSYGGEVERDDAFGEDFWAYRLDAQTHLLTVGLNFALSGALALDAQVLAADATADVGGYDVGYERLQAAVTLLMRL